MNSAHSAPVILSATRTPIGKFLGGLSPLPAPRLGAITVREAVRRAGIDHGTVDEVIMGHVLHDCDLDQKRALIDKAYAALPKGAPLIV